MSDAPDFHIPQQGERDGTIPRFFIQAQLNKFQSDAKGSPVYDNVEMVHILVPGDRKTEVSRYVTEEHRRRWPQAYAAFKAGLEDPAVGTPLSEWPGIQPGQIEELRFHKVTTVEQLAGLSDAVAVKVVSMGGMALRDKAARFIANAEGAAPMEKLAAENARKDETIAEMKAQIAALQESFKAMQKPAQEA